MIDQHLDTRTPAFEARRLGALGWPPDAVEAELARERPWLDGEQRAALWLVAWGARERRPGSLVARPVSARRRVAGFKPAPRGLRPVR